ncbi:MAG TPA: hypothetical protein VMM82_09350, partial [Spirochaetia bacterium]|nr:hypothetical protein [Spirochaetia bacterium]
MITRMSSVEIMGPLPLFDRTLQAIQDAGALHVEEIPLAADNAETPLRRIHLSDAEFAEEEACQSLFRVLQESISRIPADVLGRIQSTPALSEEYRKWDGQPVQSMSATARSLHAKVRSFARRESNMLEDIQLLSAYEEVVRALSPMVREGQLLPDQEHVGIIFEDRNKLARTLLTKELATLTGGSYLYHAAGISRGRSAAVISIPTSAGPAARSFLSRAGIAEMLLPGVSRDRPFAEVFAGVAHELAVLRENLRELRLQAEGFYQQNGPCLLGMQYVCQDLLSRYQSVPKFARTAYTFVIRGWVASDHLARLRSLLSSAIGPEVIARSVKAKEMGQPPVLLDNPQPS